MTKSKKNKRPTWFKLYLSNKALIDAVSDEAAGRGLKLALRYFDVGEFPTDTDPLTIAAFNALRAAADEAQADYETSVEAGAAGAAVRWNRGKKGGKSRLKKVEMMEIKPIETVYKGYRFRSRLEARWAVAFDAMGIKYEYEPEGFDLGDGYYYLPDFYLPDDDVWVEVKGKQLSDEEHEKLERFCSAKCDIAKGGSRFRLLEGEIPNEPIVFFTNSGGRILAIPCFGYISRDTIWEVSQELDIGLNDRPKTGILNFTCWIPACNEQTMLDALSKARKARFEHGEKP